MADIRNCEQCGAEFAPLGPHARFCSARCRLTWSGQNASGQHGGDTALGWSLTAMADAGKRLCRAGATDMPEALAVISEAVWWVTLVDATMIRSRPAAYDYALACLDPAERRTTEGTLTGLKFVRSWMGCHADPADFIQPEQDSAGGDALPAAWSEPGHIMELAVSPSGSQLAVMCQDPEPVGDNFPLSRSIRLLDTVVGQPTRERVLHENTHGGSSQPWFSPNGRLHACHVHDEVAAVWVWDTASGSPADLITYVGGYNGGRLAFSPNSRFLAADHGSAFSIRDMAAARSIRAPRDTDRDAFTSIAFSPDSRILASSSGTTIQIWTLPDA
jgi:hypothetical protein